MATEYEYKFRIDPLDLPALNAAFPQESKEIQMETVYYDTPSRALSSRRYTLRRRLENGVSVCTLKIPAGDAREEWETENVFIENAIHQLIALGAPAELQELVKEGLFPICGAKFTRIAKTIPLTDAVAELALDHGYLFGGDRKAPLCEMELELKSGDKGCFDCYVQGLVKEFSLQEEPESKFSRALKLYKMLDSLFAKYDRLMLFDTETTGLTFSRDEIIEFAAVVVERHNGEIVVTREYDELITLSPGSTVPPEIERLTGISNQDILDRGIPKEQLCRDIAQMIAGNTLMLAYNAHFDLSFLFYLLLRNGDPTILKGKDKLDLLTVYKDRHSYPHKLCNAIEVYNLSGKVVNSHRAVDDVLATVEVMKEMELEKADLERYVNLFGYNPKYGISGKAIGSVTYKPQRFDPPEPLYAE